MSGNFPVLRPEGADFIDGIEYAVEAKLGGLPKKVFVTHTLKGTSFISDLIRSGDARFSVALLYKDSRERYVEVCDTIDSENQGDIIAEQAIDMKFSYAPEITPSIVAVNEKDVVANKDSGLITGFWDGMFTIPLYARIALYSKISFRGELHSLLYVSCDESYEKGSMKTVVHPYSGESERPLEIICAKDIYDTLSKAKSSDLNPTDASSAMVCAIYAQALCHIYSHMYHLEDKEDDEIHPGLERHMRLVAEKTEEDWESEDFNASLAATRMLPYAIQAINNAGK